MEPRDGQPPKRSHELAKKKRFRIVRLEERIAPRTSQTASAELTNANCYSNPQGNTVITVSSRS
jgi:hypothetical protein